MGMDPATMFLLSSIIPAGLNFAGGAMQDGGQELEPFTGELSPEATARDMRSHLDQGWATLMEQARRPIQLQSSYVQPLPTFTGGGLPMPIGVTAQDPAFRNRRLTTFDPQISGPLASRSHPLPDDTDGDGSPNYPGNDGFVPTWDSLNTSDSPASYSDDSGVLRDGTDGGMASARGVARRPRAGKDLHDPHARAKGAVDLLLAAVGG